MAKGELRCPFSHKRCQECAVYRGRHYYLPVCDSYRNRNAGAVGAPLRKDYNALKDWVAPWTQVNREKELPADIKIEVVDMESGKSNICDLEEAGNWAWDNPQVMRVIDGVQVTSWDNLTEMLRYKSSKGLNQVKMYEGRRFAVLGGG